MSRFVDLLIEHDREYRAAAETYRLRQQTKGLAAQRQARVAVIMKGLEMTRREAEQYLEIESIMSGADWASRQQGEKQWARASPSTT
jgi:hypothetical protein